MGSSPVRRRSATLRRGDVAGWTRAQRREARWATTYRRRRATAVARATTDDATDDRPDGQTVIAPGGALGLTDPTALRRLWHGGWSGGCRRHGRRRVGLLDGFGILVHAERSRRRDVDRAGLLEVVVAPLVLGDGGHRVVAVHAIGPAGDLDVGGDQRFLHTGDDLALGARHEHRPRRRRRADVLPGEHPLDRAGDERRDGVDPTSGEVHAVGLEPRRCAVRVRRPVGDLQIAVGCLGGRDELLVVLTERVDARLFLGVGVVDVVARPQAQPDDVIDTLSARRFDNSGDRLVDRPHRVVVAGHHHEDLTEVALERAHRPDHVGRPVSLAADARLLDRPAARLGAEHEVEPLERAIVGVPTHTGQRRVPDDADVRSVSGVVEVHGLVRPNRRPDHRQRTDGHRRGGDRPSTETAGGCHQIVTN